MLLKLYGFILSPPVRASMMVCEALGLDYEWIDVNPMAREHLTPDFLKISPIHSLPTLEDGNYTLFDSHAIACYLANQYDIDGKWYPKDPKQRGLVDQQLHFNNGMLVLRFKDCMVPILRGHKRTIDPSGVKRLEEAMKQFDILLGDNDFLAGSKPTIADCCSSTIVLSIEVFVQKIVTTRVSRWLRRCESTLPGFQKVNHDAISMMAMTKSSML